MQKLCVSCMSVIDTDKKTCPYCGFSGEGLNPKGSLEIGTVVGGRYTIGRFKGLDGEGGTYSAVDNELRKRCIIKEYMPVTLCLGRNKDLSLIAKPDCEVLFKTTMMDFSEVYTNLMRLNQDENHVRVLNVVHDNETVYAVQEYYKAQTLEEYIEKLGGVMHYGEVMELLEPIFTVVEKMHRFNILHRGISPENILITENGDVKLTGFATLAMRTHKSEIRDKLYAGYSAPEQYSVTEFQGRYTDIYALAAVVYRCVTGLSPQSARERLKNDILEPATNIVSDIPSYVSHALSRALRLNPAERSQSMLEFRDSFSAEGSRRSRKIKSAKDEQLDKLQLYVTIGVIVTVILVGFMWFNIFNILNKSKQKEQAAGDSASQSQSASQMVKQTVDSFVGKTYTDVQSNAEYMQKYVFVVEEAFSAEFKQGEIISQSPEGGTDYLEGTTIKLVVSKGEQTQPMPEVVGEKQDVATALLDSLGIKYEIITVENNGSVLAGCVQDVSKDINVPVKLSSETVMLYISK